MPLRIALFGQAPLAVDCLDRLLEAGHEIAGVFAPPDSARPDPLAERARAAGIAVCQRRFFQRADGTAIPTAVRAFEDLKPDLNVMASLTAFLPSEIADAPAHGSLCFHPSLLPRYRGGNALQWQILSGERETGVTVFVPDRGVDTGPIVVQKAGVEIEPHDTAASLFFRKLAPLGALALSEAVARIEKGETRFETQDEARATFQGLVDDSTAALDFERTAAELDRRVRGCDPQPGAFARHRGQRVRLYGARLEDPIEGEPGEVGEIGSDGLTLALRGGSLRIARVRAEGAKEPAQAYALRSGLRPGDRLESG